jgi:diguanylate cyclase (GGDEF)-like protein/PAS domain S-box-containing protein
MVTERDKSSFNPDSLPMFRREEITDVMHGDDFYRFVVEMAADEVFLMKDTSEIIYANQSACKTLGYRQDELVGLHVWQWDPLFPKEVWPGFWAEFVKSKHLHFETEHKTKQGRVFPVDIHAYYYEQQGEGFLLAFVTDLTEKKATEQLLYEHANYDQLTHLPNRYLMMDRLTHAISQADRSQTKVALFFMDLNKFKAINDTYGHEAGDAVLIEASKRILSCVRHSDTVSRLGGDEFLVILEVTTQAYLTDLAEKLCDAFRRPFIIDKKAVFSTTSIGISIYPDDARDTNTLLRLADQAMYEAKLTEGGGYHFQIAER